jgi:hypothetical protein
MNSVSIRGNGYIGPIVHKHPRSAFDGANAFHDCGKLARCQVRLANLHEIDAFPHPALDIFKPGCGITRSAAICNQVTDHSGS